MRMLDMRPWKRFLVLMLHRCPGRADTGLRARRELEGQRGRYSPLLTDRHLNKDTHPSAGSRAILWGIFTELAGALGVAGISEEGV